MKYAVIYETGPKVATAHVRLSSSGCVAAAKTLDQARELMEEAIEFHIEGIRLDGETVPEPSSLAEMLDVA